MNSAIQSLEPAYFADATRVIMETQRYLGRERHQIWGGDRDVGLPGRHSKIETELDPDRAHDEGPRHEKKTEDFLQRDFGQRSLRRDNAPIVGTILSIARLFRRAWNSVVSDVDRSGQSQKYAQPSSELTQPDRDERSSQDNYTRNLRVTRSSVIMTIT